MATATKSGAIASSWQFKKLANYGHEKGYSISAIAVLPDESALVGGMDGTIYHATFDENGSFELKEINEDYNRWRFFTAIAVLPDGNAVAGDGSGKLYLITLDQDKEFQLGEPFQLPTEATIDAIVSLPDGSILLGSYGNVLYHIALDEDDKFQIKSRLDFPGYDFIESSIHDISLLPDGSALICGEFGTISHAVMDNNKEWHLEEPIKYETWIRFEKILALPDGSALVSGPNRDVYHFRPDQNGILQPGKRVFESRHKDLYPRREDALTSCTTFIRSMVMLPDGNILLGGYNGTDGIIYEVARGEEGALQIQKVFFTFKRAPQSMAVLPSGNVLVGSFDGELFYLIRNNDVRP